MWVVAVTEAVVPPCFGGKSALCPVLSSFSRSCVVAAVAVVPRGSCVFLSYKRLLGQPTDCDLESCSRKHKCFGSVSSFYFISFASSSLSFSLHLFLLSRSLHLHLHHLQFSPFLNTIIINIIFISSLFSDFSLFDSCFTNLHTIS